MQEEELKEKLARLNELNVQLDLEDGRVDEIGLCEEQDNASSNPLKLPMWVVSPFLHLLTASSITVPPSVRSANLALPIVIAKSGSARNAVSAVFLR